MKRSYPTNVDGQIFYIDEDAFLLLQNYLQQLKVTFPGSEGAEIVADIESRIRELFNEKSRGGDTVIVLADVNRVIETMGRPEQLGGVDGHTEQPERKSPADESPASEEPDCRVQKKLYRNMKNKVFGGVIGGLAQYLGWNANAMRILYVILSIGLSSMPMLHISMWVFIILYIVGWMVIPAALTPRQILQMKGTPVNVDTVGRTVIETSGVTPPPVTGEREGFFSTVFSVLGKCVIGFIGSISCIVTIGCLIGFIGVIVGWIALGVADNSFLLKSFEFSPMTYTWPLLASISVGFLLASIIFGLITWGCASVLFPTPKTSKSVLYTFVVIVVLLIVALAALAATAVN